ncbi:hypothetical protein SESBI_02917 [Sesbania bispinosa]|nr:hypothetical protein SESBI_02917 [Sesbania bispinosa]
MVLSFRLMPPKTEKYEQSNDELLSQCLAQIRDMQQQFDQHCHVMEAEVYGLREQLHTAAANSLQPSTATT